MTLVTRYHPILVALHWILAVLLMIALAGGALVLVKIPNTDPVKVDALRSHLIGSSVLVVLMLVRLLVRLRTDHPAPPSTGSSPLDGVAWVSHRPLYAAVIGQGVSGWIMALQTGLPHAVFHGGFLPADFWVYPIRSVHYVISRTLIALISLHVMGAIYHSLFLRDGLLKRMFFGRRIVKMSSSSRADAKPLKAGP
jgi:cytochrome b561